MSKPIIKANLKGSDKIELKYNGREVDMTLSDFKLYLDEVLEPTNAVLTSTEPLRYKVLLSQNAPVASTVNVSMVAGQIWTLDIYSGLDMIDPFNELELISGTIRVAGSKYRSNVDVSYIFTNTQMSYDGSPYIVSTDANGDLNPFVNTLGGNPVWSYGGVGEYYLTLSGMWIIGKVFITISPINGVNGEGSKCFVDTINDIVLFSFKSGSNFDGLFSYYPIEIKVYP